jgi:hypothetical protein
VAAGLGLVGAGVTAVSLQASLFVFLLLGLATGLVTAQFLHAIDAILLSILLVVLSVGLAITAVHGREGLGIFPLFPWHLLGAVVSGALVGAVVRICVLRVLRDRR